MRKAIIIMALLVVTNAFGATVWIPDVNNPNGPWRKFVGVRVLYIEAAHICFETDDGKRISASSYVCQR